MSKQQEGNGPFAFNRAVVFTLSLMTAVFAAIACGCPWGFATSHLGQTVVVHVFFGLAVSSIVSLAAWPMLRDSDPITRYIAPLGLLTVLLSANWCGKWHNSNDYVSYSVRDVFIIFLIASLFFYVVKKVLGWRIGPRHIGDRRLRLSHIFLWTALAGFVFAVLGWFRPTLDEFLVTPSDASKLFILLLVGVGSSLIAFAGIGVALEGARKIRNWIVLTISLLLFISPMAKYHLENGFPVGFVLEEWLLLLIPLVMFVFPWWCFRVYRSFGYSPIQDPQIQAAQSSLGGTLHAVIGCLLLVAVAYGANSVFATERGAKAIHANWDSKGIVAFSSDGKVFDRVFFDSNRPLTHEALGKLEDQQLKSVTVWGHTPEAGSLQKLVSSKSMECVILRGGSIANEILHELYQAKHLQQIYVECKAPLVATDVEMLQSALPNSEVIKE